MIKALVRPIVHAARRVRRATERKLQARWADSLRKRFAECGRGVYLNGRPTIAMPANLHVGDNVHIGNNTWIGASGGVYIGDNTHISRNCVILTRNHNYEGDMLPYGAEYIEKPVRIERNVWIGTNVLIAPGVTIGEGAIIGMGTVVAKDVPPLAIVAGQGFRVLKYRDRYRYEQLESQGVYCGHKGEPFRA